MRHILLGLLAAALCLPAGARASKTIGYRTVAAAMADLKAKKDTTVRLQDGWTIIEDKAADAVWSFVPPGHPAYPAVIRRATVIQDGKAGIAIESLCQNNRSACDKLMDQFDKANNGAGAAEPQIDVQRLGDDAFRLVLTSRTSKTAQDGQRELRPRAQQLCGAKEANFGKFEFNVVESFRDAGKDNGHLLLKQMVTCGEATAPPELPGTERAKPVAASADQVSRLERQAALYFAAKDQGRYQQAYDLMSPSQQQSSPFAAWQARAAAFNARAGAVRTRTIKQITWYRDPPQQAPGLYAAVDFVGQFANLEIDCGVVAWTEQKDGSFLLVREEEYALDKVIANNLTAPELARTRTQLGCAN